MVIIVRGLISASYKPMTYQQLYIVLRDHVVLAQQKFVQLSYTDDLVEVEVRLPSIL